MSDAPHIMIVESPYYEEINNNMMESVLIELGSAGATYERFEVPGSFELPGAIRMATEAKPDLVLLDIVMPGLDGLSALRTIKSMHPSIEVAMVSSVGGDAHKAEEAFRLGACQVLGKPFDPEVIESLVENVRAAVETRDEGAA